MSFVLTPDGMKAWPLAGMLPGGSMLPQTRNVELLGLNRRQSYEMLYRTQPWIYATVNKIARGMARLPVLAYDGIGDEAQQTPADDDLQVLMNRPYPRGSGFNLQEATMGALAIYGNSLSIKDRGNRPFGPVQHVWPCPWRFVTPIAGENEPISAYLVMIGGVRRLFFPDDVIHHQWWAPNGLLGVSPLEPLRTTLALEDAAQRYSVASFANGGRPSGVVRTASPLPDKDRKELRAELESAYGGVDNAFRIALLTHGLEWQPMSHTAVESELLALRQLTREEVMVVYDMQPSAMGVTTKGSSGRSNLEEQHMMLYTDTYGPWASMVEGTWTIQLCENERAFRGKSLKFDMTEFLRGNPEVRSQAAQRWFQSATKTPNELRATERLDPVPGSMLPDGTPDPDHAANQVYVPVNMLSVRDIERGIDLQPDGGTPDSGGFGGDVPSAEKIRDFIRMAEAAGLTISKNGDGYKLVRD